ncbi:hypothetical protein [Arthrobacter sp. NPDC058192]|uniref:hypothetical protein n=1 Tax=Arthrobacter sp. NPDC058192 TaxID=3346372 RepID=UPI0036E61397
MFDYNRVTSLTAAEFEKLSPSTSELKAEFTKSDSDDISKMERLLDLKEGALAGAEYYLERAECKGCGRILAMYDFVFTGIVDADHPKSLIVHTFIGNKYVVNEPRPVRCSNCATINPKLSYRMERYGCTQ